MLPVSLGETIFAGLGKDKEYFRVPCFLHIFSVCPIACNCLPTVALIRNVEDYKFLKIFKVKFRMTPFLLCFHLKSFIVLVNILIFRVNVATRQFPFTFLFLILQINISPAAHLLVALDLFSRHSEVLFPKGIVILPSRPRKLIDSQKLSFI